MTCNEYHACIKPFSLGGYCKSHRVFKPYKHTLKNIFMNKAAIPNPALQKFALLVGEWTTSGTHPLVPNTTLHGYASFKWIEGGAVLMGFSEIDKEGFPTGIA